MLLQIRVVRTYIRFVFFYFKDTGAILFGGLFMTSFSVNPIQRSLKGRPIYEVGKHLKHFKNILTLNL